MLGRQKEESVRFCTHSTLLVLYILFFIPLSILKYYHMLHFPLYLSFSFPTHINIFRLRISNWKDLEKFSSFESSRETKRIKWLAPSFPDYVKADWLRSSPSLLPLPLFLASCLGALVKYNLAYLFVYLPLIITALYS